MAIVASTAESEVLASDGKVIKNIPWQLVVSLRGRTTPHDCKEIVDKLDELAAFLSEQSSEFSLLTILTVSGERETRANFRSLSNPNMGEAK